MKRRGFFAALFGGGSMAAQTRVGGAQINFTGAVTGGSSSSLVAGDFSAVKVGNGLLLSGGVLTAQAQVQSQPSGGYAQIPLTMLDPSKPVFSFLQANPASALRNLIVIRNGLIQEPGLDYTLDQVAGTVTFLPVAQVNVATDRIRFLGIQ